MSYELCYEYDINIFGIQIIIKKFISIFFIYSTFCIMYAKKIIFKLPKSVNNYSKVCWSSAKAVFRLES